VTAKLRVGIVGCGILGSNHARFFSRHRDTTVAAVADRLAGRAEQAAVDIGATAYADHEAMLAAERLDLAVVATPDPLHRDPVVAAAERGVPNIIVEKPMATTLADAEAMLAAARRAGSRLWVHLPSRTAPAEVASRYVVQAGLIGAPVYGDLTIDDNISVPTHMWRDRSRDWAAGSSVAQFLFSHVVDRMRWLFEPAEVETVQAVSVSRVLGVTPDLFDAHLAWSNGLLLRIKAEWIRHMESLVDSRFTLSGERGGIVHVRAGFGGEGGWQATLDAALSAAQLDEHQRALRDRGVIARAIVRRPHEDVEGPGARPSLEVSGKFLPLFGGDPGPEMRDHIVAAIVGGVEVPASWTGGGRLPTGEDGLEQTRVVCAIEAAARTGETIRLR
jgi:predicted dehydrogenase